MTNHVATAFLEPLAAVYGEPGKPEHVEGFYREYARILGQYTQAELEAARDRLLKAHQPGAGRRWPSIPDCVAACEDARAAAGLETRLKSSASRPTLSWLDRERKRKEDEAAWSDEAKMEANMLIQSPMGRLAAQQGWVLGLHDFCRRHRRLPDPVKEAAVIAGMKDTAKFFDDAIDQCVGALRNAAEMMRAKRGQLRNLVLGD